MCFKKWFSGPALPEFTKNTIVHVAVGDYRGTANDLAGPPYDQKDFQDMVSSKWNNYVYRNHLDSQGTAVNFLNDLKKAVSLIEQDDLLLFINDNCYATSNTKGINSPNILGHRFHPNPVLKPRLRIKTKAMSRAGNYIAMSACLENETAADAMFEHPNGAYHYAIKKALERGITYLQWHQKTFSLLKKMGFDQTCTIDGPLEKVNRLCFEGNVYCFVLSSHGSYTYDRDGDEADGQDEGPFLFDRMVLDDEINAIIATNPYLC